VPKKLSLLLSSAQLQQVYHIALGFEDSFLVTWRDQADQDHIDSQSLPVELQAFLYARNAQQRFARDIPHVRCSLGPYNSSFIAHDGSAYQWMNLPTSLLSALQKRIKEGNWIDRPRLIELGANDNYVLITEQHVAIWNLENYRAVSKLLESSAKEERGISGIHGVALHTYRFGCFVIQESNGTVRHENLPPHSLPGMQAMCLSILQDTQVADRKLLARRESDKTERVQNSVQRQPNNLQQRAQLRREWGEHRQQFTAQTKGVKLSLSLSVRIGGLARLLG
jgi:hypothetical protein